MSVLARDDVLSLGTFSPISSISSLTAYSACDEPDIQHKTYFLQDEHIQLRVGHTVFRIHSHFFLRESSAARALVQQARGTTLDVEDATVEDLERFCDVLYCGHADTPPLHTQAEWTSVLHLAHRWDFHKIRKLAIYKLAGLADPVDRVVLAHAYAIPQWLAPAYHALCARDECLSDEEGAKLGLQDVLKVARTHSAMHMKGAKLDGPAQLALVKKVFGLGSPPAAVSGLISTKRSSQGGGTALVVPASVWPSPLNRRDISLAGLSVEKVREIQDAVAEMVAAQHEAQLSKAEFEPWAESAHEDIEAASGAPPVRSPCEPSWQDLIDCQTRADNEKRLFNVRRTELLANIAQVKVENLLCMYVGPACLA